MAVRPLSAAPATFDVTAAASARRARLDVLVVVVIALALVVGAAVRAWYLFHRPITSDEAVGGLIANQILHGHTYAFFWGQPFGGVEPYAVAALFVVGGHNWLTLGLTPVILSAVAAVLVWRIALRFVADRRLASLAGALAWVAPLSVLYQSTIEGGYRGVTLACGLGVVLLSARILDGRVGPIDVAGLGLVAGVGWWALPEIAYFFVPAAVLLVGAGRVLVRRRGRRWVGRRVAIALGAFVLGGLPWIWANAQSGLASLRTSSFPGGDTPLNPGYGGRLQDLFSGGLPLQLNLREAPSGEWLFLGSPASTARRIIFVLVVIAAVAAAIGIVVLCGLARGRALALVAAIVAFPFLVALQPGTWSWQDGRYTVYFGSFMALAAAVAARELGRRAGRWPPTVGRRTPSPGLASVGSMSALVIGALVLTLVGFRGVNRVGTDVLSNWGNPDAPSTASAQALEQAGITTGYADYWVAYKLDFLSGDRLKLTVAGTDPDRWKQLTAEVRRSAHPGWIFIAPGHRVAASAEFANEGEVGPSAVTVTQFTQALREHGIPFRVIDTGIFRVIVPARAVTLSALGVHAPGT